MFKRFKHRMTVRKFKQHDLGIIEDIPADLIPQIVEHHLSLGWEMSGSYNQFKWSKKWSIKLKKGTSVLELKWSPQYLGSMIGLKRILKEITDQYELNLLSTPTPR